MTDIRRPLTTKTKTAKTKTAKTKTPKSDEFVLPEATIDLEFFLKKNGQDLQADDLIREIFGHEGLSMTENEKVYCLLKAMEDLELIMPFEFECKECHTKNPIAIEVARVMKASGTPKKSFTIEFEDYIFQFERPEVIKEVEGIEGLAAVGMYMLQWLVGHNQGKDFEFVHLKIGTIIKLGKLFADEMFQVYFEVNSQCAKCQAPLKEEFRVSMDDLSSIVNEL